MKINSGFFNSIEKMTVGTVRKGDFLQNLYSSNLQVNHSFDADYQPRSKRNLKTRSYRNSILMQNFHTKNK